jgi:sodium-coupled neutral amino acid transporter 9
MAPDDVERAVPLEDDVERPLRDVASDGDDDDDDASEDARASAGDLATIFALWNTMVGSAVLAVPWAFTESGLALGAASAVVMTCAMAYTATLVLRYGARGGHDDLAGMCGAALGPRARAGCNAAMALMMAQCVVVFDMMLSTSVYGIVKGFADLAKMPATGGGGTTALAATLASSNSTGWATCTNAAKDAAKCWNPFTAVGVTAVALMCLGSLKNLDGFVAVSVLGPFFMTYLILFIVFKSVVASAPVAPIAPYANFSTFKKTAGVLSSCLFSHHAVIPVCRANSKSKNNGRNLLVAYVLALMSYLAPALAGNFSAAYVAVRRGPNGSSRAANFLRVFPPSDYYTLSAHVAVTVQFLTMVPLLLYILRTQVFGLLPQFPAKYHGAASFAVNFAAIALGSFCAAHPDIDIGMILSKCGAVFGLIFAYAAPVLVHVFRRRGNRHPLWNHIAHGTILAVGVAIALAQFVD